MALLVEIIEPENLPDHVIAVLGLELRLAGLFDHMLADDRQEFVELTWTVHLKHVILHRGTTVHLRIVGKIFKMGVAMRVAADGVQFSVLDLFVGVLTVQ